MDTVYNHLHILAAQVSNFFQTNRELISTLAQNFSSQVFNPTQWALCQILLKMKTCIVTTINIVLPLARGFIFHLLRNLRHERLLSILNGTQWAYYGLVFFHQENRYEIVLKAIICLLFFILIMIHLYKFWAKLMRCLQQMGLGENNFQRRAWSPGRHQYLNGIRFRRRLSPPNWAIQLFHINPAEPNLFQFPGNPAEPHFPRLPNYNIRQRQHGDHQHELERGEQPQLQWQQPRWQPRHPQSPDQQPEQPQPQEEQQQQHQQQQHEYNFEPDSFHRLRRFQAYPITNHTFQASNIRPRYNNIHTTRIPISSRMIDRVKRRETIQAPRQDHYLQIRNICVATFVIFLIYIALLYFEVTK